MSKLMKAMVNLPVRSGQYCVKKWPVVQRYILAEMTPPPPTQTLQYFRDAGKAFGGLAKFREKTVYEGLISFLVFWEVMCWFFVGEQIGRWSMVGYKVKGAYLDKHHLV